MASSPLSREFVELVKGIGEAKSKQEEDRIISKEVAVLKQRMADRQVTPRKMREYLIRMLYAEMLGHDASFGHIHAVKLTHGTRMSEKRVGYLCVSICLHPEHELMLLLVNTLQHDLRSSNQLEVAMALLVVTQLINKDLLLALLPLVVKAMDHPQANVRKKAIATLYRCYQISPDLVQPHMQKVHRVLCDKDPSVMGASLPFFLQLATDAGASCKELVPSFVSILKQITEHRLPREYDYRRMPAPWIQVKILQILACLGKSDRGASESMYEVLNEVIRHADTGINIGYALVYECVRTITSIYPNSKLLEEAAKCVSRFITSEYHNRKYLGIDALASIVQVNPQYAAEHQLVVIDCLDDDDETLRKKTLDLLFRMTNSQNVTVIVDNMIRFLKSTTDTFLRRDIVTRITQLAERYSPNNSWYIETLNTVFELGGELVPLEVAHSMMRLIAEGSSDEQTHENIQQYAIDTYVNFLDKPNLPDVMLHVMAWVLGEFAQISTKASVEEIVTKICCLIESHSVDEATRCLIMSAIMKLVAHMDHIPQNVLQIVDKYQRSVSVALQQRSHEFLELCKAPETMRHVLPRGEAVVDVQVDPLLPCLDDYVRTALANGARPYGPPDENALEQHHDSSLNFTPYSDPSTFEVSSALSSSPAPPVLPATASSAPFRSDSSPPLPPRAVQARATLAAGGGALHLNGVQRKWGPAGYNSTSARSPIHQQQQQHHQQASAAVEALPTTQTQSLPTSPANEQATAPPQQWTPPVMTEKEKRAAMLFGGLSTTTTTTAPVTNMVPVTRSRSQPQQPQQQQQQQQQQSTDDLLGFSSASSGLPPPQQQQQQQQPDPLLDFESLLIGAPSVQPPAHEAADLDALFSSSALSASRDDAKPPLAIGELSPPSESLRSGLESITPQLRQKLVALPRSTEVAMAADDCLRLSTLSVYPPQQPIVVLFVQNLSANVVPDAKIVFTVPPGVVLAFDGEPALSWSDDTVTLPELAANSTATVMVSVQPTSVESVAASFSVSLKALYSHPVPSHSAACSLSAELSLGIKDFLRPTPMSTSEFGTSWQKASFAAGQLRATMKTSIDSSPEVMTRLRENNIYGVQTIGAENIAAANVSVGGRVRPILLHLKLLSGSIEMLLRSPDADVGRGLVSMLQTLLQ